MKKVRKVIEEVYQTQKPVLPRTTTSAAGVKPLNNSFIPLQNNNLN
jgi:hypothetical protein